MRWMTLSALFGCSTNPPVEAEEPDFELGWIGDAPWDPVFAEVNRRAIPPLIDGEIPDETLSAPVIGDYAWRSSGDLTPGLHTLSHPRDESIHYEFEVLPYGRDPDFSPESIVGEHYRFSGLWFTAVVLDLGLGYVEPVLRVDSVEGDEITFSMYAQTGAETVCHGITTTGTLSETGELTWSLDHLRQSTEQGTIQLRDLSLHLGWLADEDVAGGVEGSAVVYTGLISREVMDTGQADEDTLCSMLGTLGAYCYDCIGDGERCVEVTFHGGTLRSSSLDPALLEAAPECALDLSQVSVTRSGDCGIPDISCAAGFFGLLGLTGWLRRRRE